MSCCTGISHSICLASDGIIYGFGNNNCGQLGSSQEVLIEVPSPIQNIPPIKIVSCGERFTVCIDEDGFVWSFGFNKSGQLGIGNKINSKIPQQIKNIPPIKTISCGAQYTLFITCDSELWSCGNNYSGQLCLESNDIQLSDIPIKTPFADISKIACGSCHSLFQNSIGEIFACGNNEFGQLGLGPNSDHKNQIQACLIPYESNTFVQFCCGFNHSLFLDEEGYVFSVGENYEGNLGLGNTENQKTLTQITKIPQIRTISCSGHSCHLLDIDGNIWSFGQNYYGQLGLGSISTKCAVPTKIKSLENIHQISNESGAFGNHFFVKDFQNRIFAMGNNGTKQLGIDTGLDMSTPTPIEFESSYSMIWGDLRKTFSLVKSARK